MHWGTFAFYSVLGGRRWATAVVYAGYWVLLRPGLGQYGALVPTVSPLLVLLLGRRRVQLAYRCATSAGVDRLS